MGTQLPPLKGHSPPQFVAIVRCGQMAGCTKMPLGMEVGLSQGDFVFDGDAAPPRKNGTAPHSIFGPCLLSSNRWLDEYTTWHGSRPRPRPHCVRRGPSFPCERGTAAPPPLFIHVYCGHGRPSQILLSSCYYYQHKLAVTSLTLVVNFFSFSKECTDRFFVTSTVIILEFACFLFCWSRCELNTDDLSLPSVTWHHESHFTRSLTISR